MILETARLMLREMNEGDYGDLCKMLKDREVMYAYEHAFDDDEAHAWLDKQLLRYRTDGYGLWAVIRKSDGAFIGQCGITNQTCFGESVPEIGYLFIKDYWHCGYAIEAAEACKNYAFNVLNFNSVYSIVRDTNIASQHVAVRNGMRFIGKIYKKYYNTVMAHNVFVAEKQFK